VSPVESANISQEPIQNSNFGRDKPNSCEKALKVCKWSVNLLMPIDVVVDIVDIVISVSVPKGLRTTP
jgi:acetyl-CoA carboxylase alpha subunit